MKATFYLTKEQWESLKERFQPAIQFATRDAQTRTRAWAGSDFEVIEKITSEATVEQPMITWLFTGDKALVGDEQPN